LIEVQPPANILPTDLPTLFLAGSITDAPNWQADVVKQLRNRPGILYNPRRDNWDAITDIPEQINWELDALDHCDEIYMYFHPGSKSPITLLELGLYASWGKLTVCCPSAFWRYDNVRITCSRYGVPMVDAFYQEVA